MEDQASPDYAGLDVSYVQSPRIIIRTALDLARLSSSDVLIDLGCGDGRVAVSAAERGAQASQKQTICIFKKSHQTVLNSESILQRCEAHVTKMCI